MIASSKGGIWLLSSGLQSSFKKEEHKFGCLCCGMDEIDVRLIDALEKYRKVAKSNFLVTNSCRCPAHNKEEGGSDTSLHLPITLAADIQDVKAAVDKLFFHAVTIFNGVGLYMGKYGPYLHVDLREKKTYWYKGKGYNYFTSPKECYDLYAKHFKITKKA